MENLLNKNILVVDDDERLLRAVEKVLRNEGCVVTCASWAAEAMEHLSSPPTAFDLIITDLQMPFVNGATILRMIAQFAEPKADWRRPAGKGRPNLAETKEGILKIPVIVLTAFGRPELRAECFRLGVATFLEKPLDSTQLLGAIESVFTPQKAGP